MTRSEKAVHLAAGLAVRPNGTGWYVRSETHPTIEYWCNTERCTCPDWQKRQPVGGCKHMQAVHLYLGRLTQEVREMYRPAVSKAQFASDVADIWGA